jgi:hypothetical protein
MNSWSSAVTTKEIPKRELRAESWKSMLAYFPPTSYNKRNPKKGIERPPPRHNSPEARQAGYNKRNPKKGIESRIG